MLSNRKRNSTRGKCVITNSEIEHILRNDSLISEVLSNQPSFDKEKFFQLYFDISQSIPVKWFEDLRSGDDRGEQFNNLPVLSCLTVRARHKIWIDVPRTFMAFTTGEHAHPSYSALLADIKVLDRFLAILCRTLCASSAMLEGRYCQGMSFIAASYILYFEVLLRPSMKDVAGETSSSHSRNDNGGWGQQALFSAAYHYLILEKYKLGDIYVKENALTRYISAFEIYLQSPVLAVKNENMSRKLSALYSHLEQNGMNVQYFIVQWFGAGYVLNVSAELLIFFQEISLYSSDGEHTVEPMMRLGLSILWALADELMLLRDFESLYMCLKNRTKELHPADIADVYFLFDLKKSRLSGVKKERNLNVETETCSSCTVS